MFEYKLFNKETIKTNFITQYQVLNEKEREQLLFILNAISDEDVPTTQRRLFLCTQKVKELCMDVQQELPDECNPSLLFNQTQTALLLQIVHGGFDVQQYALQELNKRGLNEQGEWVGFSKK